MPARTLLLVVAILAACPAAVPGLAWAGDLTVVARGDVMPDALHRVVAGPFTAASGIPLKVQTWSGGIDTLRSQLKAPQKAGRNAPGNAAGNAPGNVPGNGPGNPWDVIEVTPQELSDGCSGGLFEKLDWSAIGGKSHYLTQGVSDCGVGASVDTLVLAWDRGKFPAAPNWADFWDVAKYPGKRGLYKGVRGNLEFALMADGVAPGDVYKVLGTSEGVDRAFRKLDQLKPYIVWWQTGKEAAHILSSGDVLMTTAPAGRIMMAGRTTHRDFGVQWTAGLYEVKSWAIAKDSPDLQQAEQFLYFAGMPALEGKLFETAGISGLAKGANDELPPDLQALSASFPKNLGAAVQIDTGFWHDNLAKLQQRFDAWLAAH